MKRMLKVLAIFCVIYLIAILILFVFQNKMIFLPEKLVLDYQYSFQGNFKELNLKTADNNTLNAIHFTVENPKGVILYFHGNKGNLSRWGNITSYFTKFNYDVFVVDYRSYGKSTGDFNEKLMYQDAQLCYDYLKKNYTEDKITIYGRSLGCTFAIKTASQNKPNQLILESPFYNLKDVVKYHYPFVPYGILLKHHFNSNEYFDQITCKTTIFHGTKDKVIPITSSKKLIKNSNLKMISYIELEGGSHHNLSAFKTYQKTILELLD